MCRTYSSLLRHVRFKILNTFSSHGIMSSSKVPFRSFLEIFSIDIETRDEVKPDESQTA